MKHVKKLIIFPILILILSLLGIYYVLRPYINFVDKDFIFEKGEIYHASDYIKDVSGTLIIEDDLLDTNELGKHEYKFKVKNGIINRNVSFKYEVIDTIAPIIEIKETRIIRNDNEDLTIDEMKNNVSVNEGTFELITDYKKGDTGVHKVNVIAKDESNNESSAYFEIMIREKDAPLLLRSGNGTKILKGSVFNLNEIIAYGDDSDPKPKLEMQGYVDTNVLGIYPLHASVTDYSGNKTEWDLEVEVVEEEEASKPRTNVFTFEEFKEGYKTENTKLGIDVSSWQGDIDFEKVKEAGCEFVIIRIGFSYQGVLTVDRQFEYNIKEAKRVGLPVGIYLFTYDNSEEYLRSSLDFLFEELGDIELELPIVFDWEDFRNYQHYEMSFNELNHLYDVFEEVVTSKGYKSMLYGSKSYLQSIWQNKDKRPIWLAQYIDSPTYYGPYEIWQISEDGKIDGISERADFDIRYIN